MDKVTSRDPTGSSLCQTTRDVRRRESVFPGNRLSTYLALKNIYVKTRRCFGEPTPAKANCRLYESFKRMSHLPEATQ